MLLPVIISKYSQAWLSLSKTVLKIQFVRFCTEVLVKMILFHFFHNKAWLGVFFLKTYHPIWEQVRETRKRFEAIQTHNSVLKQYESKSSYIFWEKMFLRYHFCHCHIKYTFRWYTQYVYLTFVLYFTFQSIGLKMKLPC